MKDITRGYTFTDSKTDWISNKDTSVRLNKMIDDATVNIVAGPNITLFRDSNGINISASSGSSGSPGYYGVFYDSTDQLAVSANTPYAIKLNNTVESIGVNISNNSRINIVNGGTYNLQFSIQLENSASHVYDVNIWLRKNGSNVTATNSIVSVDSKHGSVHGHLIPSWNFVFTAAANDYYELMWSTESTDVSIETIPAVISPAIPLTPSVIVTVSQVVNIAAAGSITAGQIGSVNAGSIIGTITASQIGSINAGQINGTITASQIGSVNATTINGTITSGQIGSVSANTITGTITSGQIGSVSANTITGSLNSGQIGSVAATTITGSITSGQIGSISAGTITGVIVTSQLADQILNTQKLIASDLSIIRRVATNPVLPNVNYPNDSIILNTTNKFLYQNLSGTWTVVTSSSNITGTLTANDIASVKANTITGLIIASQISSVAATSITGSISSTQIGSVAATSITGTISSSQIGSVSASSITGSITSGQISSVAASTITGSITSGQISSVAASTITGSISSGQISSVSASTITGTITSGQIGSIDATTITVGLITDGQIGSIGAGKITAGTIVATISLESPKIAVAGACYNSSSYTSNTFGSTSLTIDDNGATQPSGFDTNTPAYLTIAGCKLYGWGHASGTFENRYGRSNPKISVFAVGEFSGIGSGAYASYAIQYSTDGGTNWYQVTAIDASVHYPGTFVSVSGAIELTGMAALGSVDFRFRLSGSVGGSPTFVYGQIQALCHNF